MVIYIRKIIFLCVLISFYQPIAFTQESLNPEDYGQPADFSARFTDVNAHRMWAEGFEGQGVAVVVAEGSIGTREVLCRAQVPNPFLPESSGGITNVCLFPDLLLEDMMIPKPFECINRTVDGIFEQYCRHWADPNTYPQIVHSELAIDPMTGEARTFNNPSFVTSQYELFNGRVMFEDGCDVWTNKQHCHDRSNGHAFGSTRNAAAQSDFPVLPNGTPDRNGSSLQGVARSSDIIALNGGWTILPGGISFTALEEVLALTELNNSASSFDGLLPEDFVFPITGIVLPLTSFVTGENVLTAPFNIAAVSISEAGAAEQLDLSYCTDARVVQLVSELKEKGIAVITAAQPQGEGFSFPGCIEGVVTVGVTSNDGGMVNASITGSLEDVDLMAPAGVPNRNCASLSAAIPHVAGAFALLKQAHPNSTVDELLEALQKAGTPVTKQFVLENGPNGENKRCDSGNSIAHDDPYLVADLNGEEVRPFVNVYAAHRYLSGYRDNVARLVPIINHILSN